VIIWILSAIAFGAAHAVEGLVGIARDILRRQPPPPAGESPHSATSAPTPKPKPAPHEAAGVLLIVGAAYGAKLLRRVVADFWEVVRDIGGFEAPRRTRRAVRASAAAAALRMPH
jgi:hypothetical protein